MKEKEKKGLFSRFFSRKDKDEQEEPAKESTVPPSAPPARTPFERLSPLPTQFQLKSATPSKPLDEPPDFQQYASDAVELEMDIPAEEFATVAISATDLGLAEAPEEELPASIDELTEVAAMETGGKLEFPGLRQVSTAPGEVADPNPSAVVSMRDTPVESIGRDTVAISYTRDDIGIRPTEPEPEVGLGLETLEELPLSPAEPESHSFSHPQPVPGIPKLPESGFPPHPAGEPLPLAPEEPWVAEEEVVEAAAFSAELSYEEFEPSIPSGPHALADVSLSTGSPDLLGIQTHVDAFSRFVSTCQTPFSAAVLGERGSGKSSFLQLVEGALNSADVLPLRFSVASFAPFAHDRGPHHPGLLFLGHLVSKLHQASTEATPEVQRARDRALHLLRTIEAGPSEKPDQESGIGRSDTMRDLPVAGQAGVAIDQLKGAMTELVNGVLEATGKQRVVVFIDDMQTHDADAAAEILGAIRAFVWIEGCVFVPAAPSETLEECTQILCSYVSDGAQSLPVEAMCQLRLDLRTEQYDLGPYLETLFHQSGLILSEGNLPGYVRLAKTSIGVNPRRIKYLVNNLVMLKLLRETGSGAVEDTDDRESLRQMVLFGVVCMEMAFNGVFKLLVANRHSYRALTVLLTEGLSHEPQVADLDARLHILGSAPDRTQARDAVLRFVDAFAAVVGLETGAVRPEREVLDLIEEALGLVENRQAPVTARIKDEVTAATLMEFCQSLRTHLGRLTGGQAPDAAGTSLRNWPSKEPWIALWYSDKQTRKPWAEGHARFELRFKIEKAVTLSVALKWNDFRATEDGVPKGQLDTLKNLPLLERNDFEYHELGSGWSEITRNLGEITCTRPDDITTGDLENAAGALKDLIEAALPVLETGPRTPSTAPAPTKKPAAPGPPCKVCGTPLEKVRLKDGTQTYRCVPCGKIYKPKATPPAAG